MPAVDVMFFQTNPRWYRVAQWSDAVVARKISQVKRLHSSSPTQSCSHTHTRTTARMHNFTHAQSHSNDNGTHSRPVLTPQLKCGYCWQGLLGLDGVLSSAEPPPETQSGDRGTDFLCWRSPLCRPPLTFPSVVEVVYQVHQGSRN